MPRGAENTSKNEKQPDADFLGAGYFRIGSGLRKNWAEPMNTIIPRKTRTTVVALVVPCCSFWLPCAHGGEAEMPEPQKFTQEWSLKPSVPAGWTKIDQKSAAITSNRNPDVFVLMKDQTNVVLVWFKREGAYWNMIVIESMTAKSLLDYGVKVEHLGLVIQDKKIFLGVEGSEAVSIFEWDSKKGIFVGEAP